MGRGWTARGRDVERTAAMAWDDLMDALSQAGSTARSVKRRTRGMADEATGRVGEARRRAMAARDALAGRRPPLPWALIGGAVAAGTLIGVLAGAAVRRALAGEVESLALEDAAAVDVATPVTLIEATVPTSRGH